MSEEKSAFVTASVLYRPMGRHGQTEQAAIITRVWEDGTVNLTVFPDFGEPVMCANVPYNADDIPALDAPAWRWPADVPSPVEVEPTSGNIFPPPLASGKLRKNGPTIEEYTAAGYLAENYPPQGFAEVPSDGLTAYRAEQKAAADKATA